MPHPADRITNRKNAPWTRNLLCGFSEAKPPSCNLRPMAQIRWVWRDQQPASQPATRLLDMHHQHLNPTAIKLGRKQAGAVPRGEAERQPMHMYGQSSRGQVASMGHGHKPAPDSWGGDQNQKLASLKSQVACCNGRQKCQCFFTRTTSFTRSPISRPDRPCCRVRHRICGPAGLL